MTDNFRNVGNIYLDTKELDRLTAEMKPAARKIVHEYGFAIATDAAMKAPVLTGALMNSILSESQMVGELTYVIQDGVSYGIYQELGTSRMPAHPFLVPALEKWREKFLEAFAGIFKR